MRNLSIFTHVRGQFTIAQRARLPNGAGMRPAGERAKNFKEPKLQLREIRGNAISDIPENPIFSIEMMNLTIKLAVVSMISV
jgi:hypothetical protein